MRVFTGLLAVVGFVVVALFAAAVGLFAYDEVKRRIAGDEFEPEEAAAESSDSS
jgi:hypothetical protein